jgi:uroporphyrinogen decarboxylase
MTRRENVLKAIRFERPDYIPMTFHINDACWHSYPQDFLFDLMESHEFLFPRFVRPRGEYKPALSPVARRDSPFLDDWGCLWETAEDGITGLVTRHPLGDWSAFGSYSPPDPGRSMGLGPMDWSLAAAELAKAVADGESAIGGLRHGHTFLQLCDMRGYENLMYDMADGEPRLRALIGLLEDFNAGILRRWLDAGAEIIAYPEDLGMQTGPMISPAHFREYIQPSYRRLMLLARERGRIIHMHSDGYLRELIDDIVDDRDGGGVDVMNLQDLVNGIDWIAWRFGAGRAGGGAGRRARTCVELDIDRQSVTASGSPSEINALIREEVEKLGSREGGLMMIFGLYPGLPPGNVAAVMDAMQEYAFFY